MNRKAAAVLVVLLVVLINACQSSDKATPVTMSEADPKTRMIERATADLANRLALSIDSITLKQVDAVTWRDGALGCPSPDGMYTQALVEGFRLVLSDGETDYHYHAGATGDPFLCPEERRRAPLEAGTAEV
jgi:hypothetical protein